jgi:hypothetical protein
MERFYFHAVYWQLKVLASNFISFKNCQLHSCKLLQLLAVDLPGAGYC